MTQHTHRCGLTGKERRRREFKRARQRYADHLVAEYFDAEEEVDRARRIPVRRASAYLQTSGRSAGEVSAHGVQMELALDASQCTERLGDREVVWPPRPVRQVQTSKLIKKVMAKPDIPRRERSESEDREHAIRFEPKTKRSTPHPSLPFPQEWRPPMGYRSKKRAFSLGGFAYGCLLGSAAAACLLLIVRLMLG